MYRCLVSFSTWARFDLDTCWKVTRGNGLKPVYSCEGIGVPDNFYVWCAWWMAGATASLVFLSGALLSRTFLGGVVAALCFFFNHGEATRVMWAPPLRETFAFPFSLLTNIIVTEILRKPRAHYIQPLYLAVVSFAYLVSWQFSQYTLMITVMAVYFLHTIELIRPLPMLLVLMGTIFGFSNSLVSMFANRMMMTSYLAGCLLAIFLMYVTLENIFNWLPPPMNKTVQVTFIVLSTIAVKMELSHFLGVDEDSHVYNIMRSKFTNYSDFDTLLYTCSGEFDFLPLETVGKLSQTVLIPTVTLVVGAVLANWLVKMKNGFVESLNDKESKLAPLLWRGIDPGLVYNMIMLVAYCVLTALIMRLKLFMTPQLCIMASLITCKKYFKVLEKREIYYGFLALIIGVMSFRGTENVLQQRATRGEYLNTNLEELLEWVSTETTSNSVFAGTMPTMANLMLSTRRPIVNHPHYETAEARRRTKLVYSVFSRRPSQVVYETLKNLQVNYLVLDENWCLHRHKPGCGMVDLWDAEEPQNKKQTPLCPTLYYKSPTPFHRVFANDGFVVLQVPSKYVQIPPPKSLKS